MNIVHGNIIDLAEKGNFDAIIHGCNCENLMESGLSKQIKEKYPDAYQIDSQNPLSPENKLGTISGVKAYTADGSHSFFVINAYTQLHAQGSGVLVDYEAVRKSFRAIKENFAGARIAYPKIGAGGARGDWNKISSIIDRQLKGFDHTLVLLK